MHTAHRTAAQERACSLFWLPSKNVVVAQRMMSVCVHKTNRTVYNSINVKQLYLILHVVWRIGRTSREMR
jgi:hypothetical protein